MYPRPTRRIPTSNRSGFPHPEGQIPARWRASVRVPAPEQNRLQTYSQQ